MFHWLAVMQVQDHDQLTIDAHAILYNVAINLTLVANARQKNRAGVGYLAQVTSVLHWRPITGEGLVFPSAHGTRQISSNVTHRLQVHFETAGPSRQRFNDPRHATASLLLAEGVDLFTVKEILGHSQISLTANTYGRLTDKLADDAAARLDRVFRDDTLTTKLMTDAIDSDDTGKGGEE